MLREQAEQLNFSRDVVPMEQKVDEAMVAVGDETGLKKLIGGDLSDTDSSDDDTSMNTS